MSDWIIATPFSIYFQQVRATVPVAQALHLVALAALLSSAVIINFRLLGLMRTGRSLEAVLARFQPAAWAGLIAMAASGAMLLSVEPGRSLLTGQFQIKMVLLVMAVAASLVIQSQIRRNGAAWDAAAGPPAAIRALAVVSLLLWLGMIMAGRWIAYA